MTETELLLPKLSPFAIRRLFLVQKKSEFPPWSLTPLRPLSLSLSATMREKMSSESISPTSTNDSTTSTLVQHTSPPSTPASTAPTTPTSTSPTSTSPASLTSPTSTTTSPISSKSKSSATLTTIPPELLIQILSHLPTTSLLPLLQTSHGLRLFISSHAAAITNSIITTQYAHISPLFNPTLTSGWLVPTLPCIAVEEKALLSKKHAGCCACKSASLSRGQVQISNTTLSPDCHPTSLTHSLSQPGPMFLHFLEWYGCEIEWRDEQVRQLSEGLRKELRRGEGGSAVDVELYGVEEQGESETEKEEEDEETIQQNFREKEFNCRIGMYCVRPFLARLDAMDDTHSLTKKTSPSPSPYPASRLPITTISPTKARFDSLFSKLNSTLKKRVQDVKGVDWRTWSKSSCFGRKSKLPVLSRAPLFGEIRSPSQASSEKRIRSQGEEMRRAMLWYFGATGVRACLAAEGSRVGRVEEGGSECEMEGKTRKMNMKLIVGAGLKNLRGEAYRGLLGAGRKIMRPFGACGGFESLE